MSIGKTGAIYRAILSHYDRWIARLRDPSSRQQAEQQKADFQSWYERETDLILGKKSGIS